MKGNIAALGDLVKDPDQHRPLSFQFTWSSFNDSAWRSARDSGALTYMPTTEVQNYADCYEQQDLVNHEAVEVFTRQADLTAPMMLKTDDGSRTPEDLQTVRHGAATAYVRLIALGQLIDTLEQGYKDTLQK